MIARSGHSHVLFCMLALTMPLVSGCAQNTSRPISAAANADALEERSLDDPQLSAFIAAASLRDSENQRQNTAWDLTKLTLAAVYYHPDIDIARSAFELAQAGARTARQVPNPTLSVGATYNATVAVPSPWTIGPAITFLLETFGRREYRTAQAQALVDAARYDLKTAAWQVRGRVRSALLNIWLTRQRFEAAYKRLALEEQLVRLLDHRLDAGEASALDVTRERINRNQISLAAADADRRAADARVELAAAIGISSHAVSSVKLSLDTFDALPSSSLETVGAERRQALTGRSDIQGLLAEYAAAQAALQVQLASRFPNLSLGPGYQYDAGDDKYSLSVSADLPIFNQNQGPIAEAEARRKQAAAKLTALQAQVIATLDTALEDYRATAAALSTADGLLGEARKRESQVSRTFAAGATDRPTLLTAQLEVAAAELSRLDAVADYARSLGALEDTFQQPLFDPWTEVAAPETSPRSDLRPRT